VFKTIFVFHVGHNSLLLSDYQKLLVGHNFRSCDAKNLTYTLIEKQLQLKVDGVSDIFEEFVGSTV
jgi:hypothetical protein